MPAPYDSFGTQLQIGDGATAETFSAIAGIVGGPTGGGMSRAVKEAPPAHDKTKRLVTKKAGALTPGSVSMRIYYDPALTGHQTLISSLENGTSHNFKIVDTDDASSETAFNGFVSEFNPTREPDGFIEADLTIEIGPIPTYPS